jgi:hypothetical protein
MSQACGRWPKSTAFGTPCRESGHVLFGLAEEVVAQYTSPEIEVQRLTPNSHATPLCSAPLTLYPLLTTSFAKGEPMAQAKGLRAAKQSNADRADNFAAAFYALKKVFALSEKHLHVSTDTLDRYYLETRIAYNGKPMFFGAVVSGRAYVSFHLMPLYWDPSLAKKVSPQLKKRMQGKSCFNFTEPDLVLFRELAKLTAKGLALYRSKNLL